LRNYFSTGGESNQETDYELREPAEFGRAFQQHLTGMKMAINGVIVDA